MQLMFLARFLALCKAGNSIAARIAMIAMTTSNSIKVKFCGFRTDLPSVEILFISLSS